MSLRKRIETSANSRIFRFLVVGLWNAFFSLGIYYLFLFCFGTGAYEIALLISFVLSIMQSFFTQKRFVWHSKDFELTQFFHFSLICTMQYLLNALSMYLLVSQAHLSAKLMQIPVSFTIAVLSYFYFKSKVFRVS